MLCSKMFPVKIHHKNEQNMECIRLCSVNFICKAALWEEM